MKLEDFKLAPGTPLIIEGASAGGEPFKYATKLVGSIAGNTLLVSYPRAAKPGAIRNGQKVTFKAMLNNGVLAFVTSVTSQSSQPVPLVFLEYPQKVSFKEIRGATRVEVRAPVAVENHQGLESRRAAGVIADISVSGARIELNQEVGELGHAVQLQAEVSVAQLAGQLALPAVIRSRLERSTREAEAEYPAVYGVEFGELSGEQRWLLYAFVYFRLWENS